MKEACDIVISQVEDRFSQSDHLIPLKLVDTSLFSQFVLSFPTSELDCAVKLWPMTPISESERNISTLKRIKAHKG